jgi:hypothetical protein
VLPLLTSSARLDHRDAGLRSPSFPPILESCRNFRASVRPSRVQNEGARPLASHPLTKQQAFDVGDKCDDEIFDAMFAATQV